MKNINSIISGITIAVVCLVMSFSVFGQNRVDLNLATRVGENFIKMNGRIALSGEAGSLQRVQTDKFPNLYIFNADGHGFIIVAGDKRVQPILGFSDEGIFDPNDMAPAAEMIIGNYDYVVDSMVRYNVRSLDESVRQAWFDLENGYYREVKSNREEEPQYPLVVSPLTTTKWGQGSPYPNGWSNNWNQFCPRYDANQNGTIDANENCRAITGCSATAMAQLLYYFKVNIPSTPITKHFYSNWYEVTPPSTTFYYFNGKYYDYFHLILNNNIYSQGCKQPWFPNYNYTEYNFYIGSWDYSRSYTRELAAKIMLDCGLSIQAMYGLNGTGAYRSDALAAFKTQFGFDQAELYEKHWYHNNNWYYDGSNGWNRKLMKYISKDVPLFYSGARYKTMPNGTTKREGHDYILDGYLTDNNYVYFHHNLGWDGSNNGYYSVHYYFPEEQSFIALIPVKDDDIHIEREINFGQNCPPINECNKTFIIEYGPVMSVTNNHIVYTQPGVYRLHDKCDDGTNIFIKVTVKPNPANDISKDGEVCRGQQYSKKFQDQSGNSYYYIIPPDETDYEGTRTFYEYVTNGIDGSIIGRCALNLTTKDCDPNCTPNVSCLNNGTSGSKDGQTANQIIYNSVTKYHEYKNAMDGFLSRVLMEAYWFDKEKGIEFWNLFQSLLDSNTGLISEEGIQQLINQSQLESISDDYIRIIAEGYNQSVMYWNEGYYTNDSLPEGYGGVIEYDTTAMRKAYEAQAYAESWGFSNVRQMYDNAYEMLESEIENQQTSVCARVTVQFTQKMTMTREAFNGTLQIFNGHESIPMQNILVDFMIKDAQGNDCTDLFQINTLSLDQITGISGDGSLAAQANGTALVQFIPTKNAAPTEPKVYSFGGSFSFIDPFTGEGLTYPLYPVEITVNPSPDLHVDYFMQRDILGDDALTTDVVEPSVPAELGVIIHNQGAGEAKNVTLETAEPQIIDNEHGLAIDFAMYGASFNGSPRQLGLMEIPFGNIGSGQTAVGEWLFTSSLLGHFVSYEANVIHNSSYGNSDLSLVSHLDIHELIHPIYAYGNLDDGINDFLVNDNPDAYDTPDSIYFSQGGRTAVGIVDNISFDHYVEPQDTIVILTINPSRIGWNYGVTEDPGRDNYDLVSCTRNYDGQVIPLNNVWQTFVTIPDGGDPVYENKLHIVDTLSNDVQDFTYTLVYSLKSNLLDVLEITGIPESSIDYPLESFTVKFNEAIIDSTFTYEDMTLKCQNGPNLMDSTVVITKVNDSIYDVSISGLTNETGLYVLNVSTLNIKDVRGHYGYNGKQASWVQVITNHTQTCTLASGWNWWSTYIDTSTEQVFDMLKTELGSNASMIKSRNDGFVTYMGGWYGTLQTINNQSMYMINMNSEQTISITGSLASLASNPITINNGWNWIGFPSNVSVDINSALNNLTPAESDLIKTRNAFATYYSSMGGWFGTLTSLTPGLGYMYQSNNEETFEFVYSTISRNDIEPFEVQMTNHWEIFVGEYSDNATLIGVIAINGEEQRDENLIVGAFIGDRCVGEVNAIYVEPFDRYMVFLTYFGNENDRITFRLYDENTGIETIGSETSLVFNANSMIGLIEEPLVISFVSTTSVEEFTMNARLFPNPVKAMEKVNVGLKNVDAASMKIEIVNTLGMVVYQKTYHTVAIDITAPRLPGIYIVKITEDNGNVYYGKLIVE